MNKNRLGNIDNKFQNLDKFRRVLVACSAGMLRSPTVAMVLQQEPFNFNTRAVGLEVNFALVPIDGVLLSWADEIIVMEDHQKHEVLRLSDEFNVDLEMIPIFSLDVDDDYEFRDPELIDITTKKLLDYYGFS